MIKDPLALTPRQQEIANLIAWHELTNQQIADQLGISLETVKDHVANILSKQGVHSRRKIQTAPPVWD